MDRSDSRREGRSGNDQGDDQDGERRQQAQLGFKNPSSKRPRNNDGSDDSDEDSDDDDDAALFDKVDKVETQPVNLSSGNNVAAKVPAFDAQANGAQESAAQEQVSGNRDEQVSSKAAEDRPAEPSSSEQRPLSVNINQSEAGKSQAEPAQANSNRVQDAQQQRSAESDQYGREQQQ